jgi:hypothetical protein
LKGNSLESPVAWAFDARTAYNALLPIPEMQIYVNDPITDGWATYEPMNNFRIDFGFWTGSQIVAVEIEGYEPQGYSHDVRRDRLLRRAEVDVIHILNEEIDEYGDRVLTVLPETILSRWFQQEPPKWGPFDGGPRWD